MKPLSHSEYKKVTRLSHNDFCRWLTAILDEVTDMTVDKVMNEVVGTADSDSYDICRVSEDELRDVLKSVGIQPHCIEVILDKIGAGHELTVRRVE